MDHDTPVPETEAAWRTAIEKAAPAEPDVKQRAALNTFFHMEPPSVAKKPGRGVVYSVTFADLRAHLDPWFKTSTSALVGKEFLPIKGDRLATDAEKSAFARSCRWRFIQLGAPCDHVNQKTRTLDGLIAVQVPEAGFDETQLSAGKQFADAPNKLEWLFQTPPFLDAAGKRYVLVANLRFRIGFPISTLSAWKQVGRLRESLASEIATHSANFDTRPGIVEFRYV